MRFIRVLSCHHPARSKDKAQMLAGFASLEAVSPSDNLPVRIRLHSHLPPRDRCLYLDGGLGWPPGSYRRLWIACDPPGSKSVTNLSASSSHFLPQLSFQARSHMNNCSVYGIHGSSKECVYIL